MADEEEIVLSEETEKLLRERAKTCDLCEWIVRTYQANGKLALIVNFPVAAQIGHIEFEKGKK